MPWSGLSDPARFCRLALRIQRRISRICAVRFLARFRSKRRPTIWNFAASFEHSCKDRNQPGSIFPARATRRSFTVLPRPNGPGALPSNPTRPPALVHLQRSVFKEPSKGKPSSRCMASSISNRMGLRVGNHQFRFRPLPRPPLASPFLICGQPACFPISRRLPHLPRSILRASPNRSLPEFLPLVREIDQ